MAGNRIESVPQTALEQLLGYGAKLSENTTKTLGNQFKPLGYISEFMTEGLTGLAKDMSWGQPLTKPGGHGPNIDPRVLEIPGPGTAMKAGKIAGLPMIGYILGEHAAGANKALLKKAMDLQAMGHNEDTIHKLTKWRKDPYTSKWQYEQAHGAENFPAGDKYQAHVKMSEIEKKMGEMEDANLHGTDEYTNISNEYGDLEESLMFQTDPYDKVVKDSVFQREYPDAAKGTSIEQSDIGGGRYIDNDMNPGGDMEIGGYPGNLKKREFVKNHETQHGISAEAGFAPGGNPSEMQSLISEFVNKNQLDHMERMNVMQQSGTKIPKADLDYANNLSGDVKRFSPDTDYADPEAKIGRNLSEFAYLNLIDEDLANLVGKRANFSQAKMDADPWFKHLNKDGIQLNRHTRQIMNPSAIQKFLMSAQN